MTPAYFAETPAPELPAKRPLRRMSAKRLLAHPELARRNSTVERSAKPVKKKPRSKKETTRIYGGWEYVVFVKSRPCAACGIVGYSEFAHAKTGGMGRKSDARHGLPLCGPRFGWLPATPQLPHANSHHPAAVEGCHRRCHRVGVKTFEREMGLSLECAAAQTASAWNAFGGDDA